MFSIVYVSTASSALSLDELLKVLQVSRVNNYRKGVTGLLLFKDGNIIQALEGERAAVEQTFESIGRDTRHRGLLKLLAREIDVREFDAWSMGFRDLRSADSLKVPGYSDFLNTPLRDERFISNPSLAHKLLMCFKRSM